MKIVSLVPSLTQTVCDFGLRSKLVGITSYCIEPKKLHLSCRIVGGTKNPNLMLIEELSPTHILMNLEENRPEDIAALSQLYNVLVTFPKSPLDVPDMLDQMGCFLDAVSVSSEESKKLHHSIEILNGRKSEFETLKIAYLIWKNPWMTISQNTYISEFLKLFNLYNVVSGENRYPSMSQNDIESLNPELLFLSSEPWPFRVRDAIEWISSSRLPSLKIAKIDGRDLSWYGTHTRVAIEKWLQTERKIRYFDGSGFNQPTF